MCVLIHVAEFFARGIFSLLFFGTGRFAVNDLEPTLLSRPNQTEEQSENYSARVGR